MKKSQKSYAGVSKWLRSLGQYGVTESDFDKTKDTLSKRFGKEAPARDVIWGLFNQVITQTKDPTTLSGIYSQMALFVNEEGRDSFQYQELSTKMSLFQLKQQTQGVTEKVEVVTCGKDSCPECQKLSGKVFLIDKALEEMPIPNRKCSYKFGEERKPYCRCLYVAKIS